MDRRRPLSAAEKAFLVERKQAGGSHGEVARELHCAAETVRKQWQAFRRHKPVCARGRPPAGILRTYPAEVRQKAIQLKQTYPFWGPLSVLLELRAELGLSPEQLPSPSRLSALFKAECPEAVQPRKKKPPQDPPPVAGQVHQRWQIDAKEKIRLGDGEIACLLEIRDRVGALMIASQAFLTTLTPDTYRKINLAEIRTTLRQAFTQWGRPAEIQTDHEDVYAGCNQSDFPTMFTLWLVGLGIRHTFSRERCPTDQPQIERNHRTLAEFSWKNQPPAEVGALQQQLEKSRRRYNQDYPTQAADCQGQPPLVRYPQASCSGRPYQTQAEWVLFDLVAVDTYLAQWEWLRKTDSNGVAYVGNQRYYLGKAHKGQAVRVRFQPAERTFRFETEAQEWISSLPAKGLEKADLIGPLPEGIPAGSPFQLTLPHLVGV